MSPDHGLDQVRREIDQEVRRLRSEGAFPPSFERRLEDLFAQVVPVGVVGRETEEALRHLESVSHVDVEVPLASSLPGGSFAKHVLRKAMAWYLDYLATQLNRFMASTVRTVRLLEERVSALEAEASTSRPAALSVAERGSGVDLAVWAEVVSDRLAGVPGPVLHAECGAGELLWRLVGVGIDAYGVDPRSDLLDEAVLARTGEGSGLDVRWADAADHLRALDDASLGGVVLSGCVDRLEAGAQRELAALAAAKVSFGGAVIVIGATPSAWLARRVGLDGNGPGLVEADLAPGRPLHPGTWAWLLGSEGLSNVEVLLAPEAGASAEPASADTAAAPLPSPPDPALARAVAMLSGPASFAVLATRPAVRPWP